MLISKRVVILLILLNLCAVNAADFREYDFDGNFKMDVPKSCDFEKTSSFFGLDISQSKVFQDFENDINISCISVDDGEKYLDDIIQSIEKEPNVNITHEDDLYLISTEKYNIVLFERNHQIIAISVGQLGFDEMKVMANSLH